jgi:two-component sensor histidine kinase
MKRRKIRLESKIVFILFLLMLCLIGVVIAKKTYLQLGVQRWQLWTFAGLLLFIYIMYLKFRTQTVERFIIDEKIKTHTLVESLPQAVVILDRDGKIITANKKALGVLGLDPASSVGGEFAELFIHKEKLSQTSYGKFPMQIKGGARCNLTLAPLGGADIKIAILEEELPQPPETTTRRVAKKDYTEFFTNIYETVRNLQKEAHLLSEEGRKNLSRLLILARKSLNIPTRVDKVVEGISKSPTELKECLEQIFESLSPLLRSKAINIDLQEKGQKGPVNVDPRLIKRAFEEVIFNAISYSKEGSSVKVLIEGATSDVTISVTDSGLGISQEEFSRIFDDGYVGAEQFAETRFGRGVGLYLARRIAELHGGSIWIESKKGLGTRVSINLPR